MISEEKRMEVLATLRDVQEKFDVKILYAIESGSRAWGFASEDSDWDVRFLYYHPRDWYLKVHAGRDVIECPINDDLDVSGWDIRKTLSLAYKCNPSLYEWLNSSLIYYKSEEFYAVLRSVVEKYYNPSHLIYHYRSMAKHNYREHLRNREEVKLKKYLYVMRAVLAAQAVEQRPEMMVNTMNTESLVVNIVKDDTVQKEMLDLIRRKREADKELNLGPVIPAINDYFDAALEHFETVFQNPNGKKPIDTDELDMFFRAVIGGTYR